MRQIITASYMYFPPLLSPPLPSPPSFCVRVWWSCYWTSCFRKAMVWGLVSHSSSPPTSAKPSSGSHSGISSHLTEYWVNPSGFAFGVYLELSRILLVNASRGWFNYNVLALFSRPHPSSPSRISLERTLLGGGETLAYPDDLIRYM